MWLQNELNSDVARFSPHNRDKRVLQLQQIRLQGFFAWVVKHATLPFSSLCRNVAK